MKHYKEIFCPNCNNTDLVKNRRSKNGTQRWHCMNENCTRSSFQLTYTYKAHAPGVKEQIDSQTLNSKGVRDTTRILGINKNTVCAHLKKKSHLKQYIFFRWVSLSLC